MDFSHIRIELYLLLYRFASGALATELGLGAMNRHVRRRSAPSLPVAFGTGDDALAASRSASSASRHSLAAATGEARRYWQAVAAGSRMPAAAVQRPQALGIEARRHTGSQWPRARRSTATRRTGGRQALGRYGMAWRAHRRPCGSPRHRSSAGEAPPSTLCGVVRGVRRRRPTAWHGGRTGDHAAALGFDAQTARHRSADHARQALGGSPRLRWWRYWQPVAEGSGRRQRGAQAGGSPRHRSSAGEAPPSALCGVVRGVRRRRPTAWHGGRTGDHAAALGIEARQAACHCRQTMVRCRLAKAKGWGKCKSTSTSMGGKRLSR